VFIRGCKFLNDFALGYPEGVHQQNDNYFQSQKI
jgi:hypothetical protein